MATKKKNNSRKALAVALGIMGVAGLSLASASQLTVNPSDEVQVGVGTFANCQGTTPITVDYTYDTTTATTTSKIKDITFKGIAAACINKNLTFTLDYTLAGGGAGTQLAPVAHALVAADTTAAGYTYTATAANILLTSDLGAVTVVIK